MGVCKSTIPSDEETNYDKLGHGIHNANSSNGLGGSAAAGDGKGSDTVDRAGVRIGIYNECPFTSLLVVKVIGFGNHES